MVDLQEMQADYLTRIKALQQKYGVTTTDKAGNPTNLSANDKYQYQLEFDAIYGQEYEDRVNALFVDRGLSTGGNLDKQTQLFLSDQAKRSFGVAANASAPIPDATTAGVWWDNTLGKDSPLWTAKTVGDLFTGVTAGVTGDTTTAVEDATAGTSSALALLIAGVIVFILVENL